MPEISIIQEIVVLISALFAGFIDAICGGGGLIIIPMLIAFGLGEQLAISTHKFQAMFAMCCSFSTLFKYIEFKKVFIGMIFSIIGGILGARVLLIINPEPLKPIILFTLLLIFIYSIFNSKLGSIKAKQIMSEKLFYPFFGLLIGFYDGFLGPATGSFWIFASISLIGQDIKQASINAKALCMASGMISLIIFMIDFKIYYSLGLKMAMCGIFGAFLGAKFVLKYKSDSIKKIFLVIVFITLIKVTYEYYLK
ncbi:TSUP family transporter [Campylobacter sp. 2018MI27]|uniref:sulfite exporter TauE/SafE family protein n=1 Tax=Campylobacter sp. 2018MI27 TaxID=2836738 RepID=UPI001BDB0FAD|nr:TSUP family transporter [Campylobacter sp. 2018MI27]MBT0881108.1 TSUP family transporter [Campylobacter sp. 2018MI27]